MSNSEFRGPRAKLARGRNHIAELFEQQNSFFAANPPKLRSDPGPNGIMEHCICLPGEPTAEAETICADAIGNLRSALDLAASETGVRTGASNLKNTYFNIASTEAEWENSVVQRTKACPPEIRTLMRTFEPWDGGNELLYALSKLAAVDKHQLLVSVAASGANEVGFNELKVISALFFAMPCPEWDFEKKRMVVIESDPEAHFTLEGIRGRLFFSFSEGTSVSRQPVVPTLNAMACIVESVILAFEAETARLTR